MVAGAAFSQGQVRSTFVRSSTEFAAGAALVQGLVMDR